ncbi:hypothetical protein H9P43_006404 [Blastocladiella emersonii ATCC 22665]|nr:hypothetical protein H9P43_006404 [Blastocladiella emersonii ATCC 22665]
MQPSLASAAAPTPLFGGGLEAVFPAELIDVSQFRQVPDNQEVWVDATTSAVPSVPGSAPAPATQDSASLIIELLELDETVSIDAMATFHLDQVARDAESEGYTPLQTGSLSDGACRMSAGGVFAEMNAAKFGGRGSASGGAHAVFVLLWVIRVPSVKTDIVVTWNLPRGALGPGIPGAAGASVPRTAVDQLTPDLIARCAVVPLTLSVVDWGLFC